MSAQTKHQAINITKKLVEFQTFVVGQ
ncbi:hypothetical protein L8106_27389 [Lyngbya sp. PCC 8106]|nr:hypothetical protein L8106_27389 [Lyngbya sp. PCC 8106]